MIHYFLLSFVILFQTKHQKKKIKTNKKKRQMENPYSKIKPEI